MTPEEKRIKIAELVNPMGLSVCSSCWNYIDLECCACGSPMSSHVAHDGHSPVPMGCRCGYDKQPQPQSVPNFLHDLNAMHSAEEVIMKDDSKWGDYCDTVYDNGGYHATAEQKADAFLYVHGIRP